MKVNDKFNTRMLFTELIVFLLLLSFLWLSASAEEINPTEIIKKMDTLIRGDTSYGVADMTIVTPNWTRTVSMKSWSRGTQDFFIHITAPARESGTTFLKQGTLLYQWVPSAEMRIKISPSMMLQSWMGSDFTNDDLVKESSMVNDYTHQSLGRETVNGADCYKIQCDPKPSAPVVWGKLIIWVNPENWTPVQIYYFDEKGNHIKTLDFSNIQKVNDRMFPMSWTMTPLNKQGHSTSMTYKEIKFNIQIDPQVFSLKNLENPR